MQIDWLTVAAQIINFLVLVWLLKRFMYGPIMRAVDEREARIAGSLEKAELARSEAADEAARYRKKLDELADDRENMLKEAAEDASALRAALEEQGRAEVDAEREEWLKALADEKASFMVDVRERVLRTFTSLARQGLADLADADLQDQVVGRFLKELHGLDEPELAKLKKIADGRDEKVLVRTAFALSPEQRRRLTTAVCEILGRDTAITFEGAPELICGIEIRAAGQLLRWSLDGLMEDVEVDIANTIKNEAPRDVARMALP
ncbi:MAG: F0F1 ATP synthase subunit delta [Hyphomicrobiaceae bacterium]